MSLESFIQMLVGSLLTLAGVIIQQHITEKRQKERQIRQDKINIIKDIASSKIAISVVNPDNNKKAKFSEALNLIPIIFQDNEKILNAHEKFSDNNSNTNLYDLVMLMHDDVGFKRISHNQFFTALSA